MDISHESPSETEQRLRRVIATADLYVFPDDLILSRPHSRSSQHLKLIFSQFSLSGIYRLFEFLDRK